MTTSKTKDFISENNNDLTWRIVGAITLSIRFVQGFIFWGGGSRRFIYAPQKLDPHAANWLANKLQSAMPGALLGLSHAINFLLHHFVLLYIAIILFSLAELLSGAALIIGFFTRTAGLITAVISIFLLLIFGWEGSTCLDEWTMAVANLAMGLTLALSGSSYYSVDSWLLHRYPNLQHRWWFTDAASGPWSYRQLKRLAWMCLIATVVFTLSSYNYYRGAIYSKYHAGPVSPIIHHFQLSNGILNADGSLVFHAYVDAGNTAIPSHIIRAELRNAQQAIIEEWTSADLGSLPSSAIHNDYLYNQFTLNPYGIVAPVSASATIKLTPVNASIQLLAGDYHLVIYTVNGNRFTLPLKIA